MRTLFVSLALIAGLSLMGCKGGISSTAEYQKATAGVASQLKKLDSVTGQVRTAGDPQRVNDALGKVVPAAKALQSTLNGLQIAEPNLSATHGAFLAAVNDHVAALDEVAAKAQGMPIPESKQIINDSAEALAAAVDAWQTELDAM